MKDLAERFAELDYMLDQVLAKIDKVHRIMYAQDINLLTPAVEKYRAKYLEQLHRHRQIIEEQQNQVIDQIDIKEIMSVVLEE